MNKITILAISAVFVASILAITAFEVEAIKPANETEEKTETRPTELKAKVSDDGRINNLFTENIIFYGDVLCKVTVQNDEDLVIVFGMETTVLHMNDCFNDGLASLFDLKNQVDSTFQKGDLLALDRGFNSLDYIEVYREQTLP